VAIVRTAGFRVRPGSRKYAEELVATLATAVRAGTPGTRLFLALQDSAEPARFTLVTIFDDAESETAHNAAAWSRTFGVALNGHLEGGFSYLEYAEVPGAGLFAEPAPPLTDAELPGTMPPTPGG